MNTKDSLIQLVDRFQQLKTDGGLNKSSEATMRAWIDELLAIFGWDVQNTHQVLTEHTLGKDERQRLHDIGSTNTRPDYTLVNGNVALAFVDAKSLDVDIKNDKSVAFQIRSYGWSVGAQYSIVTNFDTLAIYDCQCMPRVDDDANVARLRFYDSTEYVDNYEILHMFLLRENIITKKLEYSHSEQESLDYNFSKFLGEIRIKLAESIIRNNRYEDLDLVSSFVQTIINRILFIRVCESKGLEKEGLLQDYMNDDFWTRFKNSSYFEFYEHYDGPMFNRINPLQSLVVDNDTLGDFVSKLYYPSPYRFDVIPVKTLSDIYDLFLGYRLVLNNGVVSDQLKEEFKKSNGAVTTPEMLVHKVIECTMPADVIDSMSITELLNLKIADIACGSGVFLVGAYDFLASQVIKKITEGQAFDNRLAIIKDHPMLTIEGRRAIINSCIYGVDINPEAVDVAKMSLSLKMIDDYNSLDFEDVGLLGSQILHGVGNNIKCGNSLVGSSLVGSLYILDEPSIGLHSRDTDRLIHVLRELQGLGNTVVVVEHDEEMMKAADWLIDIGPDAGSNGGQIVYQGRVPEELSAVDSEKNKLLEQYPHSYTIKYLTGTDQIPVPSSRRSWNKSIILQGCRMNNLAGITAQIPLNVMTVVTGVSGSGKSSLVKGILYPALKRRLDEVADAPGEFLSLEGNWTDIKHVEFIDQNPIGKSTRSNPATYLKAYDAIRQLYAEQPLSVQMGYTPQYFSFNADGGRCEECKGAGYITVEMQFMADLTLECEACHGQRFKKEILDVRFEGKNINDILNMTVNEALDFFSAHRQKAIVNRLKPLQDVGLGYIKLGQNSSTLSGGENQRVKLAYFIGQEKQEPTLFIFDEPTTGLHFHDISRLLKAFNALIERGHTVLVIEHNLDVIKCADWIIDLGPEGGNNGGKIVCTGTPEEVIKSKTSITANYLKDKLS